MSERFSSLLDRAFPRGIGDFFLQLVILAVAYYAWRYARGAVDGSVTASFANARDLISAERSLGLLFEPGLQRWAVDQGWAGEIARWGYANLHFRGSLLMLGLIYFLRPGSYPFVRNMVIAAMVISTLGYAFYPTAPPRFIPEMGMDVSSAVTGNNPTMTSPGDPLFNPFAAVPSMHVGMSMMLAWSLALLLRNPFAKAVFFAYPLLMTYIVCATGNHYWLDAVFGALAAALACCVAAMMARVRPEWSFSVEGRLAAARVPATASASA